MLTPASESGPRRALEELLDRFEAAWQSGSPPHIEDFLAGSGPDHGAALWELVHTDLEFRLRAGQPARVEDYLQRFPELADAPENLIELLLAEYRHRCRRGDRPVPEELLRRFPRLAEELAPRLQGLAEPTEQQPPRSPASGARLPARVGRYRIEGELARGGMGVVLRVRDEGFGRPLAMKILLGRAEEGGDLAGRFVREAALTGRLQHPGIPPVHDRGTLPDGRPYFVMKLVEGRSLRDLLRERSSPAQNLPRFVGIFEQVCLTVAYAHGQGVIHRDLKPANVMVGAFGEVQVMDWGLAKVLASGETRRGSGGGPTAPVAASGQADTLTSTPGLSGNTPRTAAVADVRVEEGVVVLPGPSGSTRRTAGGTVLGTPAYMAPEQARGEVEGLDRRCDVFGLGALLCEILTGAPPFAAPSATQSHHLALGEELADVYARLEGCGADAELVWLAKHCLAPDREDRPPAAAAVAEAVACYQQELQRRLKQAEIERASAQARAEEEQKRRQVEEGRVREERKRRRVQLYLAAAVVVLLLGGLWFWGQQVRRAERQQYVRREVGDALQEATARLKGLQTTLAHPLKVHVLLSEPDRWKADLDAAAAAWRRAAALAESDRGLLARAELDRLQELGERLPEGRHDFAAAEQLDRIRQEASLLVGGQFNPAAAGPRYEEAFAAAGLDVRRSEAAALAARIRRSPLRYAWVAALDHWADSRGAEGRTPDEKRLVARLLAVAREADPDPWRNRVRDPKPALPTLRKLAQSVEVAGQSPQILVSLSRKLPRQEATGLLRRALLVYPRDFWLHFQLGALLEGGAEQAGCFQAAAAIRPSSSMAHSNWGAALADQKDYAGAVRHYRKALDLDPKSAPAHYNWGITLFSRRDYAGAIRHYQKALELDPRFALAHSSWGVALAAQNDHAGAVAHYRKALEIDPGLADAHANWGLTLAGQKDFAGAISHCRKALELAPRIAIVHYNWGHALYAQKDPAGAIPHYRKALQLAPRFAPAHYDWGNALLAQKDYAGAISHFQMALELAPNDAKAHNGWGLALTEQKDYAGAVRQFKKALDLDPRFGLAHYNWGNALKDQKDYAGAITQYQKALALNPNDAETNCNLGIALCNDGRFGEGVAYLGKGHQRGSKRPDWAYPSGQWLEQCRRLLQRERRSVAILQGKAGPSEPAESLQLARFCRRYQRYAAAARLYAAALKPMPGLPERLAEKHRYRAACAAALAAAGQGKDAGRLAEEDRAKLHRQALGWLRADLKRLAQQSATDSPAAILDAIDQWSHWLGNPELAAVREETDLVKRSLPERQEWRKFWVEVRCLHAHAEARFRESRWEGALTAKEKQQVREVKLHKGKTYAFDLEAPQFDAFLRLTDAAGKTLAENADVEPGGTRNSRVVGTASADGTYRVVVTSLSQQGTGGYTLLLREFIGPKK
jgi:tetratricopeptide (TPR) repeat protein/serine/threonine protein kinase